MNISDYYNLNGDQISFTREQGSQFAKGVAGDFNPIHDADSRKFCVPGDLLFSVVLQRYGVSKTMLFEFSGMVTEGVALNFPEQIGEEFSVRDFNNKEYMRVTRSGEVCKQPDCISEITEQYVTFSGQTFPHILVPLMRDEGMMINPERPLVIYKSMIIQIDEFADGPLKLSLDDSVFDVNGKKGEVTLTFSICRDKKKIGSGKKHLLLSGLRPYEQDLLDTIINAYAQWKDSYINP